METIIIGQGYNIKENTSVGKELVEQFNSKRYKSFTCLVAFASYGGISAMTPYIETAKSEGVAIKVVLGVDQKGTSKEALEEVLSWDVDASIYHTKSINIFHPKIYLFENEDIFTMIVGSNNLTEMGLVKNVECSLLIKDIKSNPVHGEFYNYWKNILDGKDINLYPITQDLIELINNACDSYKSTNPNGILSFDIDEIKNDIFNQKVENASNVPHFSIFSDMYNKKAGESVSATFKPKKVLFKEFDEFSRPQARAYQLCVLHELDKLNNKKEQL